MPVQTVAAQAPWWQTTNSIGLVVIGLLGVYVAWRQWRTARQKLRFDLFERRLAIYEATIKFLEDVRRDGLTVERYMLFDEATVSARWLFGYDAWWTVRQISDAARRLLDGRPTPRDEERILLWDRQRLEPLFRQYLHLPT